MGALPFLGYEVSGKTDWIFAVLFGGMLLFLVLETLLPRLPEVKGMGQRWLSNISIALLNYFSVSFAASLLYLALSSVGVQVVGGGGLLAHLPTWVAFGILLIVLEGVQYWLHRAFHTVPWLWRIHAVHHSDLAVDVTTSHRHHPLEPLLGLLLTLPIVLLLAPPPEMVLVASLTQTSLALWSHSNLYVPEKIDACLRYLIVTPDFHRLLHHSDRRFTDSNYSLALPWFDYLFATATRVPFTEQLHIRLGLEYFRNNADLRLDRLLLMPFVWRKA